MKRSSAPAIENEEALSAREHEGLKRALTPRDARPWRVTKATFDWRVATAERPKHKRSLQRLIELVAMSKQAGGMKRAIARMRCGDQVVEQRRRVVG